MIRAPAPERGTYQTHLLRQPPITARMPAKLQRRLPKSARAALHLWSANEVCQTISTHMYSASAQRSCRRAYPWQAPAQGGSFPKRTHHRFNPAAKRSLASALIRCPGASQGSFIASPEANTASLFNPSTQHITASHLRCLTPKPSHVVSEPALPPLATNLRLPLSSFRDF